MPRTALVILVLSAAAACTAELGDGPVIEGGRADDPVAVDVGGRPNAWTLVVDPDGSDDGDGSEEAPFATLARAAAAARPGTLVLVHPGVYTGDDYLLYVEISGTAAQPIVFRSSEPRGAILDGRDNATAYAIGSSGSHLVFEGFEVRGFSEAGLYSYGDDVTYRGNHIHDIARICSDTAIGLDAITVIGNGILIEDNLIHDVGRLSPGEQGCAPETPYYMNHDHGVYVEASTSVVVRNNVFHGIGHGWPIHVYSSGTVGTSGLTIANNTFVGANPYNPGQILLASPSVRHARITNNLFDGPGSQAAIVLYLVELEDVDASANLTHGADLILGAGAVTGWYNLVDVDPALVDPAGGDFRLRADSPAVDAGIVVDGVSHDFDLAPRPMGAAFDLGAFELDPGAP